MRLLPNTLKGLLWGLKNFDGIEFDIRLTSDYELVIHHDPYLASMEYISDMSHDDLRLQSVPKLKEFMDHPMVKQLTDQGKKLWIEMKPNCDDGSRIDGEIAHSMYKAFQKVIEESDIDTDQIRIIAFSKELLLPFVEEYNTYPIIPDVNECSPNFMVLKALPKFFIKSLASHLKDAAQEGHSGILFAREYLLGWMSKRHPSYPDILQQASELGLELGSNLGSPSLELEYREIHRFSDKLAAFPRLKEEPTHGDIIAHRGTGTKGVEVPDSSLAFLTSD